MRWEVKGCQDLTACHCFLLLTPWAGSTSFAFLCLSRQFPAPLGLRKVYIYQFCLVSPRDCLGRKFAHPLGAMCHWALCNMGIYGLPTSLPSLPTLLRVSGFDQIFYLLTLRTGYLSPKIIHSNAMDFCYKEKCHRCN